MSFVRLMQKTEEIPRRRPYRSICGDFLQVIPGSGSRERPGSHPDKGETKDRPLTVFFNCFPEKIASAGGLCYNKPSPFFAVRKTPRREEENVLM